VRWVNFVAKLEEQKLLLNDPNYVRTTQRWTKVNVRRQAFTKQQAVRPWWTTEPSGQVMVSVKFGSRPVEFENGKGRHRGPFQGQAFDSNRYADRGGTGRVNGRSVQLAAKSIQQPVWADDDVACIGRGVALVYLSHPGRVTGT
jgi:hypothetical protein